MTYRSLDSFLKEKYGTKVYKLSLSTGCTCPNRDGTAGRGGCAFCSAGGSGDFAASPSSLEVQLEEAKKRVAAKLPKSVSPDKIKYIAYFQSYTSTYGDTARLSSLFEEAAASPGIAAVSIATRPDCVGDDMLAFLSELNKKTDVWVELGLQTIHGRTALSMNRCYELNVFEDCYRRLKNAGLSVIVHLILSLPGEDERDMLESVSYVASLCPRVDGVKLQLLHVLKGTALAAMYEKEPFHLPSLDEYCDLIVKCLRLIPKDVVIHRLTGDAPKSLLIEPQWTAQKKHVLNTLRKRIAAAAES